MYQAKHLKWLSLPLLLGSLTLGGCGSAPPIPSDKMLIVERTIIKARNEEAQVYATLELSQAEKKLQQARDLISKEEYALASRVLDEALIEAESAETKSHAARASKQASEMEEMVDSRRQEVEKQQQQQK